MKKNIVIIWMISLFAFGLLGCGQQIPTDRRTADQKQTEMQAKIEQELTAQTGMPAIKNGREKKIVKMLLEMRDQENLATYTYIFSEMKGKFIFMGDSIGYGIPYATQYTNPQKDIYYSTSSAAHMALPQADPNGLFSPASAEGTWVLMKDENGKDVYPMYIESRITVTTHPLPKRIVITE